MDLDTSNLSTKTDVGGLYDQAFVGVPPTNPNMITVLADTWIEGVKPLRVILAWSVVSA